MDNDRSKVMEEEGCVEAPAAEVCKSSIRKSSRLQSKKSLSSCSKYAFKSYRSNSKYTTTSSKANLYKEVSISESKIQEEKKHQFPHRNAFNGVFSTNNVSMKSSTVVPTFEYHVQAIDGICLVVDLNLKRSDWLKSLEKAVCVCQNHSTPAIESFRKEVKCLGDRNNLKVSSPDKTSASDTSMNSYVQNKFSIRSINREVGETLPSVVEKEIISVSGSKRCWSKVNQKPVLESSEKSEEGELLDSSSPHKGSLCSRTGNICSKSLLSSTTVVNQEADGNDKCPAVTNEEGVNSAKGMKVSGREENAIVIYVSDDESKTKKRYYRSDHSHGQSHQRILRSTPGGRFLEHDGVIIWRSSRLRSK